MQPTEHESTVADPAMRVRRVRQNVAPAAIGAAFLLFFGFYQLAEPTGTELFDQAWWVFYHTLRVGGVALTAVAAWSLFGYPITLAVDAVVTVAIGLLLILTGLGMAADGGALIQTIINVVCGGMFVSSGVRNWKDYRLLAATSASIPTPMPTAPSTSQRSDEPTESQTSRPGREGPGGSEGRGEGQSHRKTIVPQRQTTRLPRESNAPTVPSPEGFLAALAKKPLPPTDEKGTST